MGSQKVGHDWVTTPKSPMCFPGGLGEESTCQAGDVGLIPGLGRFPGEGNDNPFQYACLGNPWTGESGGLQFMGWQRVGPDLVTKPPPTPPAHLLFSGLQTWREGAHCFLRSFTLLSSRLMGVPKPEARCLSWNTISISCHLCLLGQAI